MATRLRRTSEASRRERTRSRGAARRLQLDLAPQDAGAHVEHALHAPGRHVERLAVGEQAHDRAVGRRDDRLPGAGEPVGVLGVGDRPGLVEAVEHHPAVVGGRALLGRAAHAEVAVAEREHRLERGIVAGVLDEPAHAASSPRSSTTTWAPASRSSHGATLRATPITSRNSPARPAATPASASSTTAARSARTPTRRDASRKPSGSRLAAQAEAGDLAAVDDRVERVVDAGGAQHLAGVGARGDHRGADAHRAQLAHPALGARERLHAVAGERALDQRLLAVADLDDLRLGQLHAARAQEVAHAVVAGLAVDVVGVLAVRVEAPLAELGQQRVERALPAVDVQLGRRGQDPVKVEQHGVEEAAHQITSTTSRRKKAADAQSARTRVRRDANGSASRW